MKTNFPPAALAYALPTISYLLSENLLKKKEIIDWSDKIVLKETEPDIFFIELSLMSSKSTKDIASHLNSYTNTYTSYISGKPVLSFILKKFSNAEIVFPEIIRSLYFLIHETSLSNKEESFIYQLDHTYEIFQYTKDQHLLMSIDKDVLRFLRIYRQYSLPNYENWQTMDADIDRNFDDLINSSGLTF